MRAGTRSGAAGHDALGRAEPGLVYQSRSGPPTQPWLEPDIADYIRTTFATKWSWFRSGFFPTTWK